MKDNLIFMQILENARIEFETLKSCVNSDNKERAKVSLYCLGIDIKNLLKNLEN